jgi:hypothetical protein
MTLLTDYFFLLELSSLSHSLSWASLTMRSLPNPAIHYIKSRSLFLAIDLGQYTYTRPCTRFYIFTVFYRWGLVMKWTSLLA